MRICPTGAVLRPHGAACEGYCSRPRIDELGGVRVRGAGGRQSHSRAMPASRPNVGPGEGVRAAGHAVKGRIGVFSGCQTLALARPVQGARTGLPLGVGTLSLRARVLFGAAPVPSLGSAVPCSFDAPQPIVHHCPRSRSRVHEEVGLFLSRVGGPGARRRREHGSFVNFRGRGRGARNKGRGGGGGAGARERRA